MRGNDRLVDLDSLSYPLDSEDVRYERMILMPEKNWQETGEDCLCSRKVEFLVVQGTLCDPNAIQRQLAMR